MITTAMLMNELRYHLLRHNTENYDLQYQGIYLSAPGLVTEKGMIYIGDADTSAKLLIENQNNTDYIVISAGDSEKLQNAPVKSAQVIVTGLTLIELYNTVNRMKMDCERWKAQLTAGARNGMPELLRKASELSQSSFILYDTGLYPQAYCIRSEDRNRISLDDNETGENSKKVAEELLSELRPHGPVRVVSTQRKDGHLFFLAAICRGNTVLGYLEACSTDKKGTVLNHIAILQQILAESAVDSLSGWKSQNPFQNLALSIFSDQPGDLHKVKVQLQALPKKPKRFMRGIVARIINEDGQLPQVSPKQLRGLYRELEQLFPADNVAILEDCVFVLTGADNPSEPLNVGNEERLAEVLERYGAYAMAANPSESIRGLRTTFKQCFQILPAAVSVRLEEEKNTRLLLYPRFSSYYIIQLCEAIAAEKMGTEDIRYLCPPGILTLTRYDRAYHSNLRDTLFTYLMNDRSITETSKKMFMHRNTTIYKLNKITEILQDNLEDPYTRHQLVLGCMVIRYAEMFRGQEINLPPLDSNTIHR